MTIVFTAIIFIISISFHEYAHAWASYKLGDPTAKNLGRLTPNPFSHIDPIGFLLIFLIGFGWGRPVPIDARYYKNPARDELLVALAGPLSNIILAFFGIVLSLVYIQIVGVYAGFGEENLVVSFWRSFAMINVSLAVFNMIPVPPLDGYRIITYLYPPAQDFIMEYYQYLSFGFLLMIVVIPFTQQIIHTYIASVSQVIFGVLYWLVSGLFFL